MKRIYRKRNELHLFYTTREEQLKITRGKSDNWRTITLADLYESMSSITHTVTQSSTHRSISATNTSERLSFKYFLST